MVALLFACAQLADSGATPAAPPEAVIVDPGIVFVGQDVVFDGSGSTGDAFDWDFGDGRGGSGEAPAHAYGEPGRYTVILSAVSADGRTDSTSTSVVAVNTPLTTAPTLSGRLALLEDRVFAVLPEQDEVVVVGELAVVERWPTCGYPVSLSASAGVVAVACRDDAVWLHDAGDGNVLAAVSLRWGSGPVAVAVDSASMTVRAALSGTGEVVSVGFDGAVSTLIQVPDPRALAVGADGFVTRFRSDDAGGVVTRLSDAETFEMALDAGPDSDTDARGLPTLLGALALSPDGEVLVVGGAKANIERGLRRDGQAYTFETASRASLRALDRRTGAQRARATFDNRDLVGAVAFTPLGDRLFVAHYGAGVVDVLDPWALSRVGGLQNVGVGLDGVVSDGDTAWVLASVSGEVVVYDVRDPLADTEIARVSLFDEDPLGVELRLGAGVFAFAGDPRMSTDAYLSCASCHFEGGSDRRTWDFSDRGEGFRDTQPLWAMPAGGPLHWSANFDEVQDFENAIRAHQGGDGFMYDAAFAEVEEPLGSAKAGISAELDALAAYVRSHAASVPRSPFREEDGAWTAEAEAGRVQFVALGCDGCHAGPELTDAGWVSPGEPVLHDVGTLVEGSGQRAGGELTGLRTPSLRGLFASPPYLHDGRAPTLETALAEHGIEPDPALIRYLLEIEGEP